MSGLGGESDSYIKARVPDISQKVAKSVEKKKEENVKVVSKQIETPKNKDKKTEPPKKTKIIKNFAKNEKF